jgi:predicted SAM-dependent methyltransferase
MRNEIKAALHATVNDTLVAVRSPLASRRFGKAVTTAHGLVKVNVGAGEAPLDGWINTDVGWWSPMYLDLTKSWPVPPASVDRIYGDNVIEHFPLDVGRAVLRNCYEALRPGGLIRLATPDVERTVRAYLDDPVLTADHLARHRRHGYPADHPVDLLRITYAYHGHHQGFCYDWAALSAELADYGFTDIRRCEAGQSEDPSFRGLESRHEPTAAATELIVEARRAPHRNSEVP